MSKQETFMFKQKSNYGVIVALLVLAGIGLPAVAQQNWQSRHFPPPNGGLLTFTFIGGNPACASYNGRDCLWDRT